MTERDVDRPNTAQTISGSTPIRSASLEHGRRCADRQDELRENDGVQPETRYARSGNVSIAYQVVGEGPFDLVFVPGAVSHVELGWRVPRWAQLLTGLAEFRG